jgi:hypothetical protein
VRSAPARKFLFIFGGRGWILHTKTYLDMILNGIVGYFKIDWYV